jgi:dCMP deaminase
MKHEYLFNMARSASTASKDPSTKVGCIISRPDGSIVSSGYNGFPKKCNEKYMTFDKPMKYLLIRHAERNAISETKEDLTGCVMHVTHAPCHGCLSEAVHNGIREIYYQSNELFKKASKEDNEAVLRLILATQAIVMNKTLERSYVAELADMYGWQWAMEIFDSGITEADEQFKAKYCLGKSTWEIETFKK